MIKARPVNAHRVVPLIWANLEGNPILPPGHTREKFTQGLAGSRCLGFFHGNELIGCATFKDGYLHLDVLPEWKGRWLTVGLARDVLEYGLQNSPWIVAVIEPQDRHVIRLAEFLGFKQLDQNELFVSLRLTRDAWRESPWGKPAPTPAPRSPLRAGQRHAAIA